MGHHQPSFQDLINQQIRIRDLQGKWRRVATLTPQELDQLWDETTQVVDLSQFRKSSICHEQGESNDHQ